MDLFHDRPDKDINMFASHTAGMNANLSITDYFNGSGEMMTPPQNGGIEHQILGMLAMRYLSPE